MISFVDFVEKIAGIQLTPIQRDIAIKLSQTEKPFEYIKLPHRTGRKFIETHMLNYYKHLGYEICERDGIRYIYKPEI